MRQIALLALLLAFAAAVYGQENILEKGPERRGCDFTQVRDPAAAGRTAR